MAETQRRPRGLRSGGGEAAAAAAAAEIVEVQGGHIVRATGRKDRHSKVCTAKGLRDRRVRLSAHTAIQFYDVQDRLGYDRPSKAVDWLIKNAKPAIDQLAQLPPWRPPPPPANTAAGEKPLLSADATQNYAVAAYGFRGSGSGLLPPSLDSDSIADTIKSFFPMAAANASSSSSAYQAYPSVPDLLSHGGGGSSSQAEDLRLSLQSLHDPIFEHQHSRAAPTHQALFAFDTGGSAWPETNQRAATWNLAEHAPATGGGGYLFGVPPQLAQSQFFTQWGPLQSSNPPSFRAMADPNALGAASGNQMHLAAFRSSSSGYPQVAAIRAASTGDVVGFSGFHIPARMRGGEEEHGGVEEPPSASSASRH